MQPSFSWRDNYILSRYIDINSRYNEICILPLTILILIFKTSYPGPIQNAWVYISFCVARIKSDNRAVGHDSID